MSATGLTLIVFGIGYSSQALLAPMLQQLMNYDTMEAGMILMPRGIGTTLAILISGRLVNRIDPRITVAGGLMILVFAQLLMSHFALVMGRQEMIIAGFLQGTGNGLVVMPLTMIVFVTLAPHLRTDAAAVTSLIRISPGRSASRSAALSPPAACRWRMPRSASTSQRNQCRCSTGG